MTQKLMVVVPTAENGSIDGRLVEWMFTVCTDQPKGWEIKTVINRQSPVVSARNSLVRHFLSTDCDVMFTIDSDQVPQLTKDSDDGGLRQMLAALERDDVDIVTPITVRITDDGPLPVINKMQPGNKAVLHADILSRPQGLHELSPDGTIGGAGVMVKRKVLEAFDEHGVPWFWDVFVEQKGKVFDEITDEDLYMTRIVGHDIWFFLRAYELGFRAWVDTRVFWGHIKTLDIRDEFIRDLGYLKRIEKLNAEKRAVVA